MSVTISIRFLTGRAHLHPWQTHHSEGRVEWPPSPWRLLRALVAVAGRGLTSLPYPDDVPQPNPDLKISVEGVSSLKKRGVPKEAQGKLSLSKAGVLTLKALMTDAEANAWKVANTGESFAAALDQLRTLASAPEPVAMADVDSDEIPLSRLTQLLHALSVTPTMWLPKTSGGHTRQYFPIHDAGMVKNTGSAVFDTFATVRKDQPLCFHWPELQLDEQQQADFKLLLGRMTYFGRAESWCRVDIQSCPIEEIVVEGRITIVPGQSHWECRCIEDHSKPVGHEYRDYLLERRLAPIVNLKDEVAKLLPRTRRSMIVDDYSRKPTFERFSRVNDRKSRSYVACCANPAKTSRTAWSSRSERAGFITPCRVRSTMSHVRRLNFAHRPRKRWILFAMR